MPESDQAKEIVFLPIGPPPPIMTGPARPNQVIKVTIPWWDSPGQRTESRLYFEREDVPVLREFCREFPQLLALAAHPGSGFSPAFLTHLSIIGREARSTYNLLIEPRPPENDTCPKETG